jgi:hypothetical protein
MRYGRIAESLGVGAQEAWDAVEDAVGASLRFCIAGRWPRLGGLETSWDVSRSGER